MKLRMVDGSYSVARLEPDAPMPDWALPGIAPLESATRTADEFSIVALDDTVPERVRAERGFRAMVVDGVLDFSLVGILASLTTSLAERGVSVFALSTFDTDYLLVKTDTLDEAISSLEADGHEIINGA